MKIKTKLLNEKARLPEYSTSGAACFDIRSTDSGMVVKREVFGTGLSFEIPQGHAMLVFSRSGHGFKDDVRLSNCVGILDSDYRGELKVKLAADGPSGLRVEEGDRIAQAMVIPVSQVEFVLTETLSDTERGQGGFGSTGSK